MCSLLVILAINTGIKADEQKLMKKVSLLIVGILCGRLMVQDMPRSVTDSFSLSIRLRLGTR